MRRYITPEVFLVMAALLWGGTFVAIKLALDSVPPFLFLSIRFMISGLAILLLYRKILFNIENLRREYLLPTFVIALTALAGYAFQTLGLGLTSATQSGFITGSYVIFIPLLQILIEKKLPSLRTWIAVLIVALGLYFISQNQSMQIHNQSISLFALGNILTLVSSVFFAFYIILMDIYSRKIPAEQLVSFQILFIAILSSFALPLEMYFSTSMRIVSFDFKFWMGVIYTALFATILTTQIQARYQKSVTPARAGILFSVEPVFSFIIAYIVLGERLSLIGGFGCLLILGGIFVSELGKSNKTARAD